MRPAGFWRRSAAWSLDAALLALPLVVLGWNHLQRAATALAVAGDALLQATAARMADAIQTLQSPLVLVEDWLRDPALLAAAHDVQSALSALLLPPLAAFIGVSLVWCVAFERSRWQATPGKRALGLRVVDAAGRPLGTAVALARFIAGSASWLTLNVGHLMAAWPPHHLALHDRISRTRVCLADDAPERMPAWARAWLWLLGAALVFATAWAMATTSAAMQVALERALG